MSRPIRLIPQAAQAYNTGFVCPLCGGTDAAYVFSTNRTKVYRCGGCALTIGNAEVASSGDDAEMQGGSSCVRTQRHYAGLIDAVDASEVHGPILLLADRQDSIAPLIAQRGHAVITIASDEDIGRHACARMRNGGGDLGLDARARSAVEVDPDPRAIGRRDSSRPMRPAAGWHAGAPDGAQLARVAAEKPLVFHARDVAFASAARRFRRRYGSNRSGAAIRSTP